jgi:hypothetical protein
MRVIGKPQIWSTLRQVSVFPHRVKRIKCLVVSFGAFEKVKLYKARHLVEMTIT